MIRVYTVCHSSSSFYTSSDSNINLFKYLDKYIKELRCPNILDKYGMRTGKKQTALARSLVRIFAFRQYHVCGCGQTQNTKHINCRTLIIQYLSCSK